MEISSENKSKDTVFTVASIIKKMNRFALNFEHSQQREFVWERSRQYNLISDLLQVNPLPELVFAEQILHNAPVIFCIEGKQRCTVIKDYVDNKFSVGNSVTRHMIKYSVPIKDEDGCLVRDEDGNIIHEIKECDIRGKKFRDLPVELQDNILDYKFKVVLYCNCSETDIAYHIQRYNSGKPMNAEQRGMTYLGAHNASVVRNISSMPFFSEAIGNYNANQFKTSKIFRIITESVMATTFLDDWNKNYEINCKYIEQNVIDDDFEMFRSMVEELEEGVEPDVGKMFDDVDSFIWFGLYSRFRKTALSMDKFNEFMLKINEGIVRNNRGKIDKNEPMSGICLKEIDGVTLEQLLCNSSTKDANVVKMKIDFLTKLMCDYFHIEMSNFENNEDTVNEEFEEFAQNFESDEMALKTLMLTTDKHEYNDFEAESLISFRKWCRKNVNKMMLEDCLSYKSFVEEAGIEEDDYDLPLYVYAAMYIFNNDYNIDISKWLSEFKNSGFAETGEFEDVNEQSNVAVVMKQQKIISSINKYLIKENEENEII